MISKGTDMNQNIVHRSEERRGGSGLKMDYHIIFLPKKSLFCEKRLKVSLLVSKPYFNKKYFYCDIII